VTHFLQLEREFSIAPRQIAPGSDFFRTLLKRLVFILPTIECRNGRKHIPMFNDATVLDPEQIVVRRRVLGPGLDYGEERNYPPRRIGAG
jgi:hypothetical protein